MRALVTRAPRFSSQGPPEFAARMLGYGAGLGVLALMAFDPMQIHFSQHAQYVGGITSSGL